MAVPGPKGSGSDAPRDDLPKGVSNPARRALASAGITRLEQVAGRSEAELLALHGFGPKAIRVLREALSERGLSMKP